MNQQVEKFPYKHVSETYLENHFGAPALLHAWPNSRFRESSTSAEINFRDRIKAPIFLGSFC